MINKERYMEILRATCEGVEIKDAPLPTEAFYAAMEACFPASVIKMECKGPITGNDFEQAYAITKENLCFLGSSFKAYEVITSKMKTCVPVDKIENPAEAANPAETSATPSYARDGKRRARTSLKGKIMSDGVVYNYRRHRRFMPYMFPYVTNGNVLKHLKRAIHAYRTMKLYPANSWQHEKDISKQFLSYVEHATEACLTPPEHPRWTDNVKSLTHELYSASHEANGDLYEFIKRTLGCNVYSTNAKEICKMFADKYRYCWSVIQRTIVASSADWEENTLREIEDEWASRYRDINDESHYTNITTPAIWGNPSTQASHRAVEHRQALEKHYGNYTLQDVLNGCDMTMQADICNCSYFKLSERAFMAVFENVRRLVGDAVPKVYYPELEAADRFGRPYNKVLTRIFNSVLSRRNCKERGYFGDLADEYDMLTFLQTHDKLNGLDELEAYKSTPEFKEIRDVLYSVVANRDEWDSLCDAVNHINKIYGVSLTTPEALKEKYEQYQAGAIVRHPDYNKLPKCVRALIIAYRANSMYDLENGDEVLSALATNWEHVLRELGETEF